MLNVIYVVADSPWNKPVLDIDKNPVAADEEVTLTCDENNIDALPDEYHYEFVNKDGGQLQNTTNNKFTKAFGSVTVTGQQTCIIRNYVGASEPSESQNLQVLGSSHILCVI